MFNTWSVVFNTQLIVELSPLLTFTAMVMMSMLDHCIFTVLSNWNYCMRVDMLLTSDYELTSLSASCLAEKKQIPISQSLVWQIYYTQGEHANHYITNVVRYQNKSIGYTCDTTTNNLPWGVKLNNGGNSLPFGNLVAGSRNSSKKQWAHASRGEILADGIYSNNLLTSWIASCGVLGLNTCKWNVYNDRVNI
jgi:hypothetical protein